jgi:hypothetical protein
MVMFLVKLSPDRAIEETRVVRDHTRKIPM